jgi:hypothetical protein
MSHKTAATQAIFERGDLCNQVTHALRNDKPIQSRRWHEP